MPNVHIDWIAVVLASVVNMAVGFLWYSRQFFGLEWSRLTGRKLSEMSSNAGYVLTTLGAFVQSWILAHFLNYSGSTSFAQGAVTGFWLWLGFTGITSALSLVFEKRPTKLWIINAGYFLVVLVINGGLIASLS